MTTRILLSLSVALALPGLAQDKPEAGAPVAPPSGEKAEKVEKPGDAEEAEPEVPEDVLEDEHIREEYGVNQFTTPSIRKLFTQLDALGELPYEKLKRQLPKSVPSDRTMVALSMGVLIGDGFLSVQTEQVSDLEDVGRAVLRHAKTLSAGARVTEHAKSILENSVLGDWKSLRDELAATQRDVEKEMVLLRDMEIAHLIAMGGWLRGLQIASGAASEPFSPDKARVMARTDLAEYFGAILADLDPKYAKLPEVKKLQAGLEEIRTLVELPDGKAFDAAQVKEIYEKSSALVLMITGGK